MLNVLYFNLNKIRKDEKKWLFEKISKEQKEVGYYSLPETDISEVLDYEKSFDENIKDIVVVGIGGSSLGAKAVYNFLKPLNKFKRELHFLETTDPITLKSNLSKIDLNKAHFIVISKSGTTIETISIFKYLYSLDSNPKKYTFITDSNSPLEKFANDIGSKVFNIPSNVGGRFSVLSNVGLVPLSLIGVDIKELLSGARFIKNSFFNDGYIKETLLNKAIFYAKNHTIFNINILFAYSEVFKEFKEWYIQLWAESLGKKQKESIFNVGVTPIGLIGPVDQHSFLQLIMEGTRDKSVTFITIKDFKQELKIPNVSLKHLESLDNINNLSFSKLINMQSNSVKEALLIQEDIPIDEIIIDKVSEKCIGKLIFYYELLTSLMGILIDVNSYDQPGVELGKRILKNRLQSSGFSNQD